MKSGSTYRNDTLLSHLGRESARYQGMVNVPVCHASTILFEDVAALRSAPKPLRKGVVQYGRAGNPTTFALEDTIAGLEGAYGAIAMPSGLAAIAGTLMALTESGDHVLIADTVYAPTRSFCLKTLAKFGVTVEFYDPLIGASITGLLRDNTRAVFIESPGSLTFEVQDIPAIAAAVHAAGGLVIADNTWATPLYCQPMKLGADVTLHAGTKYIGGHADVMLGLIVTGEALFDRVRLATQLMGYSLAPDDAYLALRGARTLSVRLARHQETGLALARWLAARPEVSRVLHPALPDDPGHALWRRDFTGASGLFSVVLAPCSDAALVAMLDGLELFGLGYSWGGYESLIVPCLPQKSRTATRWEEPGPTLRIHAGLEDPDDLIADLEAGLQRLNKTMETSR